MFTDFEKKRFFKKKDCAKIIILARCHYTVLGIKALCENQDGWEVVGVTSEQKALNEMLSHTTADALIIETESLDSETTSLSYILQQYPDKTLLLTNSYSGGQRKVDSIAGVTTMIDKSRSLSELRRVLARIIKAPHGNASFARGFLMNRPRVIERQVVSSLLTGKTPNEVALNMGISYAAVSRYKMIALRRAGVKSLNEVIAGNYQDIFIG